MQKIVSLIHRSRLIPVSIIIFIMWLTYDFHLYLKDNLLKMQDFQVAAVFAYAGSLVATIKVLFDHIAKKIEKDDEDGMD